jgi:hypothetical protein
MKNFIGKLFFLLIVPALFACKNGDKSAEVSEANPEKNILEKIADAHGFQNWKNIQELRYTFNVGRDTSHFERSWIWRPKENKITLISNSDTTSYVRSQKLDGAETTADRAFINDKYWLLFPFNLMWDKGFSYEIKKNVPAPISGKKMTEISISYNQTDGYTPGDTYKIYVDGDFMIREWSYFPPDSNRDGKKEPAMSTTWEGYKTFNGIKIATMHQDASGSFKLYFDGVSVK